MEKETKATIISYLITAGLGVLVYFGMESLSNLSGRKQANCSIKPRQRDMNNDGLDDLVLKLKAQEFILYKTENGYSFNKP